MEKKVSCIILGTKAEYIKTFPLMLEMQRNKIPYIFIHTGQHDLLDLCKIFGTKQPDVVLTSPPKKTTKFYAKTLKAVLWSFGLIFKIKKEVNKIKNLEYVYYHGDTITTAVAAIATSKLFNPFKEYKTVHLEAGLRSGDLTEPFPEEISRKIADGFSDILLAVSNKARNNLKKERIKGKIIIVGNTIVDSAAIALKKAKKIKLPKKYAVVTLHRHENIKSKKRLERIISILENLSIPFMFSLHDNTKKQFQHYGLLDRLKSIKKIKIIENKNYADFIYLISKATLILTDGGSMQEESLIFKKPCILLRKKTERQEGLRTQINYLSELDLEKTKKKIDEYLEMKIPKFENPYGKTGVSKKIIKCLYQKRLH